MSPEVFRGIERLVIVLTCPMLLFIGYRLFVLGVTGEMKLSAGMDKLSAKLTTVAPGGVCFVLAVALGAYSLFRPLRTTRESESPQQVQSDGVVAPRDMIGGSPEVEPGQNGVGGLAPRRAAPVVATDASDAPPPKARTTRNSITAAPAYSKEKTTFEYASGPGGFRVGALSTALRAALGELWLCEQTARLSRGDTLTDADVSQCRQVYGKRFRQLPSAEDLKEIERLETEAQVDQTKFARLVDVRQLYERSTGS
jgi:hypothetical protein